MKKDSGIRKLVAAALFALIAVLTFVKIYETDTWWHLKAGQLIAETKQLPQTDVFSHTRAGEKWINDEWMGDLYLYTVFSKHGITGLQVMVAAVSVLMFFILYHTGLRIGAEPLILVPLLAAAALAARVRLTPRPEIFSLFFICAVFYLVNRVLMDGGPARKGLDVPASSEEEKSGRTKRAGIGFFLIPVMQMLWVNCHPGAPFGLVILGCAIAGSIAALLVNIKAGASFTPMISAPTMRRLGVVFVAAVVFTALNPYGLHGLLSPLKFASNDVYLKYIAEWAPIPLEKYFSLYGPPGHLGLPFFLSVAAAGFLLGLKRLNLFHFLLLCLAGYMAVTSRRFIATFAMLAAPIAAAHLTPALGPLLVKTRARTAIAVIILAAFAAAGYYLGVANHRFVWGQGVNEKYYPAYAIDFIREHNLTGNMYNTYSLGGALVWGLYPDHKVFIDGRVPVYGRELYSRVMEFESDPGFDAWKKLQDDYGLTFAVVKNDRRRLLSVIDAGPGDWRLVYWGRVVSIYAKNIPEHRELIAENEYIMTDYYSALDAANGWKAMSADKKAQLSKELIRNIETNPNSLQALLALVYIMYVEENYDRAFALAGRGLEIDPRQARLHAVRGEILLRSGRTWEAVDEFQSAARIHPDFGKRLNEILKESEK